MILVTIKAEDVAQAAAKLAQTWCYIEEHKIDSPKMRFSFHPDATLSIDLLFTSSTEARLIARLLSTRLSDGSVQVIWEKLHAPVRCLHQERLASRFQRPMPNEEPSGSPQPLRARHYRSTTA